MTGIEWLIEALPRLLEAHLTDEVLITDIRS